MRNANELARMLQELGDLVDMPDDEISMLDRVDGDTDSMLSELVSSHRAVLIPIPTAETNRERWISTENFPLYRAAFRMDVRVDEKDRELIQFLAEKGPVPISGLPLAGNVEKRVEKLINGYMVLGFLKGNETEYAAAEAWIPDHILEQGMQRREARISLIQKFMRYHGPVTKYEIMERYGFPDQLVEEALTDLYEAGLIATGEYVPTKSFPQWCYKSNLEQIHRLTLNRLRKEMEPATPEEYADFLIRWQHIHPDTQLSGLDGLREVLEQLQGQENFQAILERDVLPARVKDYTPAMLDRLCYSGEVFWRRFEYRGLKRGQVGFCFRKDRDWLVTNPDEVEMDMTRWDEDIPDECNTVRDYLRENGACFFGDMVKGTSLDWRYALRAIWHLVWTGEATNDGFESIRHASFTSGLSGCYDLFKTPRRPGVDIDYIVKHMMEYRRLDPTLGRWAPTERLIPSSLEAVEPEERGAKWAELLLKRYGIVSRESLKHEVGTPAWKDIRRALMKMELLGKVRRGFFMQEFSGEQYAYPEAVEALHEAKLRHPDANGTPSPDEPMILLNGCDPANSFTAFLLATNEAGEEVRLGRNPHNYAVIQNGRPLLRYKNSITLLVDLSRERTEKAMRALMRIIDDPADVKTYKEIQIRDWNDHPADVSPARHLLTKLGFVRSGTRAKGFTYDGLYKPDSVTIEEAEQDIPEVFEREGKEEAPVEYNAEWIISRSHRDIRSKVRELIQLLEARLPEGCEFIYHPRDLNIRYRGVQCIRPHIQQKQIRLQITHRGWTPGFIINSDTDLSAPAFLSEVFQRFESTRQQIDSKLDAGTVSRTHVT